MLNRELSPSRNKVITLKTSRLLVTSKNASTVHQLCQTSFLAQTVTWMQI